MALDPVVFAAPQVILVAWRNIGSVPKAGTSEKGDYIKKEFSYILFVLIKFIFKD